MNLLSVIDVAEQIQQDKIKLTPEQLAAYQSIMLTVRQAMLDNPEMAVGVIFEIAGQLLCEAENMTETRIN